MSPQKPGAPHRLGLRRDLGDYDNDGFDDIFITYYGNNVLYHKYGNGIFRDITEKPGLGQAAVRYGSAVPGWTTIARVGWTCS